MASDASLKMLLGRLTFIMMIMVDVTHTLGDPTYCGVSKNTTKEVKNCPNSITALMEAANRKNCSAIKSTCLGRLEYHCVINPWGNLTLEVCAPATNISSGFCAEYNEGGAKIQEYINETCTSCTEKYLSTDAYKHPECYPKQKCDGTCIHKNGLFFLEDGKESSPHRPPSNNGFKGEKMEEMQLFLIQLLLHTVLFFN